MKNSKNILTVTMFIVMVFLFVGCGIIPTPTPTPTDDEGVLTGQVMAPEDAVMAKQLTGQALANATVNILDPDTGDVIATTTTDENGNYEVVVPEGGPYILQAEKDNISIQQITPKVEEGEEYDLGTADETTTAIALIAQAMLEAEDFPDDLSDIDLEAIENDPNFDDVLEAVQQALLNGENPAQSIEVIVEVWTFLYPDESTPPAPSPPGPTPPTDYEVTNAVQDPGTTGGDGLNYTYASGTLTITQDSGTTVPYIESTGDGYPPSSGHWVGVAVQYTEAFEGDLYQLDITPQGGATKTYNPPILSADEQSRDELWYYFDVATTQQVTLKIYFTETDFETVTIDATGVTALEPSKSEYGFELTDTEQDFVAGVLPSQDSVIEGENGLDTTGLTPVGVTLKATTVNELGYDNVKVLAPEITGVQGGTLQLWAYSADDGKWFDAAVHGWGSEFTITPDYEVTTDVYVFADIAGTYEVTFELVDLDNSEEVIATKTETIKVL